MATQSASGDISTACSEQNSLADTRGHGYVADKLRMMMIIMMNKIQKGDIVLSAYPCCPGKGLSNEHTFIRMIEVMLTTGAIRLA